MLAVAFLWPQQDNTISESAQLVQYMTLSSIWRLDTDIEKPLIYVT